MDQNRDINYRVNIDDSNFQAKLTQLRASLDASIGGMAGAGLGSNLMFGMVGASQGQLGQTMGLGGFADFGSQIRPVTYTPPAIAMQPHFGMVAIQQTLGQAGLASMGPVGMNLGGMAAHGIFSSRDAIPMQMSAAEYMSLSSRAFSARVGDAVGIGALSTVGTVAGLAAGSAGSALGSSLASGTLARGALGLIGGAAAGVAVGQYFGAVTDQMADNRAMQESLAAGSFRFMTGSGADVDRLTGRGFSMAARQNISTSIQNMELNDPRFGMQEYKGILEAGMQMDMFSGTRDAEDFKNRFKGLVENLKTITATLHTGLKEGMEVIRGMRDMGVTDPSEINRLTLGAEVAGRASGRTGLEMMAIGQTGAEMFRGTGINMARGFELAQQNVGMVRTMLNAGTLTRETIAQAGGENALAQQMTAGALASFQTTLGRGAMMANFNPATGQLNPNMVSNMFKQDAMSMVANAANLGPQGIISLQAHQEELISKMSPMQMQMMGIGAGVSQARMLVQAGMANNLEDAYIYTQKMQGKSHDLIQADLAMMKTDPEKFKESQELAMDTVRRQAALEDVRNRFNIGKRVSNALTRTFVQPVSSAFTELAGSVEQSWQNATMAAMGVAVGDDAILKKSIIEGGSSAGAVVDARGSTYSKLVGGQTSSGLMDLFESQGKFNAAAGGLQFGGATAKMFKDEAAVKAYAEANKTTMSIIGQRDGQLVAISSSEAQKAQKEAGANAITQEDRDKAGKRTLSVDAGVKLTDAIAKSGGNMSVEAAAQAVFGENFSFDKAKEMTGMESGEARAMLRRYASTTAGGGKLLELIDAQSEKAGATISDMSAAGRAAALSKGTAAASEAKKLLSPGWSPGKIFNREEGAALDVLGQLGPEAMMVQADLATGKISRAQADVSLRQMAEGRGLKFGGGLDSILSQNSALTPEQQKRLGELKVDIKNAAAVANEQGVQAAGGEAGKGGIVTGAAVGQISVETSKQLLLMGEQLMQNYKALQSMHEALKTATNPRSH